MKKIASYHNIVLCLSALLVVENIYAQPPPPPVGLPIDGGILFLLISGLFLAVFKIKSKKE